MHEVGFVETPLPIARLMVSLARPPTPETLALDAGAGRGVFLTALWEAGFRHLYAVEYASHLYAQLKATWQAQAHLIHSDFLTWQTPLRFDLIIGNPPYVHFNQLPLELRRPVRDLIGTSEGDIYYAFILKALTLLRPHGELIFIVPYTFFYNTHALFLRTSILREGSIDLVIDLDEARLFAGESPETVIFRFRKGEKSPRLIYLQLRNRRVSVESIVAAASEALSWRQSNALFSYTEAPAWQQAERWGPPQTVALPFPTRPLKDVARVGVGLVSGFDRAFRIEDPEEIPPPERRFIHPFVKAIHCRRPEVEGAAWYILLPDEVDEESLQREAPFLYRLLLPYRDVMMQRYLPPGKRWFHWQALRNYEFLRKHIFRQRIYVPALTRQTPTFTIGKGGLLPAGDVLFIQPYHPDDIHWLATYLNSAIFLEYYLSQGFRRGGRHVITQRTLEALPVPLFPTACLNQIRSLSAPISEARLSTLLKTLQHHPRTLF